MVDLPAPLGPSRQNTSPSLDAEAHVGDGELLAVALLQVLDVDHAHATRLAQDDVAAVVGCVTTSP